MTTLDPKQLARVAEFLLEEAVLSVLARNAPGESGMGAAQIGRIAGIFRDTTEDMKMNDATTHGILNKLLGEGRVVRRDQLNGRGGWALADNEYEHRIGKKKD